MWAQVVENLPSPIPPPKKKEKKTERKEGRFMKELLVSRSDMCAGKRHLPLVLQSCMLSPYFEEHQSAGIKVLHYQVLPIIFLP
jgi:hypothetical protein